MELKIPFTRKNLKIKIFRSRGISYIDIFKISISYLKLKENTPEKYKLVCIDFVIFGYGVIIDLIINSRNEEDTSEIQPSDFL